MSGPIAAQVREAIGRGDLCAAYDLADTALREGEDPELRYLQVLSLARMGVWAEARRLYDAHGLGNAQDMDCAALGARLLKDRAVALAGDSRRDALVSAADAYQAIHAKARDPYPGINAASLWFLAGEPEKARRIAQEVIGDVGTPATYYDAATLIEANLLCGHLAEAEAMSVLAAAMNQTDLGALSTTRRQLAMVADAVGTSKQTLLAPLSTGQVMVYCGHIFSAEDHVDEAALSVAIDKVLAARDVRVAFGPLAAGSDILIAEALLRRGAELNVALPFARDDFVAQSVLRPGRWVERFQACMEAAASVTFATDTPFVGDPWQFSYGGLFVQGLARLRARHLCAEVFQLAIWDGKSSPSPTAGTAYDVAAWKAAGGETVVIPADWKREGRSANPPTQPAAPRSLNAYIFCDFKGFTKISEVHLPRFWSEVLGRIAPIVESRGAHVTHKNTWGDGIFLVVTNVETAADIALEIQEVMQRLNLSAMMPGVEIGVRIGAHFGPAYRAMDHISGVNSYFGSQVSLAARIEPLAPAGEIYVTQAFAAILASQAPLAYECPYVGRKELPKGFGIARLHRLVRA